MARNNYTLGRGELYFAQADGPDLPRGERYLGNTPDLSFSVDTETLDHTSSDRGINEKDASVIIAVNRSGTFTCDDMMLQNIALFWFGDTKLVTVTQITGETDEIEDTKPGILYQIGQDATNPAGVRNLKTVTIVSGASTTLESGTDYILDEAEGTVEFLTGGNYSADDKVTITYSADAHTFDRVVSGNRPIEGSLRFRAKNPIGEQMDYFLPKVTITPNGDFPLKGDSWQQVSFNVEILKRDGMEAVYVDGKPMV